MPKDAQENKNPRSLFRCPGWQWTGDYNEIRTRRNESLLGWIIVPVVLLVLWQIAAMWPNQPLIFPAGDARD